jgi:hypothetical protein
MHNQNGWTSPPDRPKVTVMHFVKNPPHAALAVVSTVALAALVTLTGCATGKFYNGPAQPQDQLAVLFRHANYVQVLSVDGHAVSILKRAKKLELLPGPHTIECCFQSAYMGTGYASESSTKGAVRLSFDAKAGYSYWIEPNVNPFKEEWHPNIISSPSKNEEPGK